MEFSLTPIGRIHSCFPEKFGIPRQPGLVPDARAELEIFSPFDQDEAFRGIEEFSHLWIIFIFHACIRDHWKSTVRPPRLGGNRRMGVFATRSGFRPNPVGLSVVELERVARTGGKLCLYLKAVDLLDGTPVLDIKPYLPYADIIENASGGFAPEPPAPGMTVEFSPEALAVCQMRKHDLPHLESLIRQVLQNDPRPAYYGEKSRKNRFGTRLYDMDVQWESDGQVIRVVCIQREEQGTAP